MTTRGEINSNFYQIVNVDGNGSPTSIKGNYIVSGNVDNADHANVADVANSVSVSNVAGIGNIATVNLSGNGTQTLLGNGTWGALPNTANANYANFAGTAFNVSGSNVTGSVANATYSNISGVSYSVSGSNVTGTVGNATHSTVSDTANSVSVANVSGIGNIATTNYDGNSSHVLYGNGVWANIASSNSVANANYANFAGTAFSVSGSNVSGDVSGANHANISDSANSVAVANVSGIGNIATINLDGSSSNVLYGNGQWATISIPAGDQISNGTTSVSIPAADGNIVFTTNGVQAGTFDTNQTLQLKQTVIKNGSNSQQIIFGLDNANGGVEPQIVFRASAGNLTNPEPLTTPYGSMLMSLVGSAYNGTDYGFGGMYGVRYQGEPTTPSWFVYGEPTIRYVQETGNSIYYFENKTGGSTFMGGYDIDNGFVPYVYDYSFNLDQGNGNFSTFTFGGNSGNLTIPGVYNGDGGGLSNIAVANVAGLGNIATINLDGNVSNVLAGDGTWVSTGTVANANYANFAGTAYNVSGSNVSGEVANANYATFSGTAYSVSGANVVGSVANSNYANVAGTSYNVSGSNVTGAVNDANHATVSDSANSVAVANVVGIGNIATVNLTGSTSNVLYGNGVFAAIPTISNVANANYSNFAGEAFSVSASNIVGTVNLANYATVANSVAGANVTGEVGFAAVANSVSVANVSGIGNIATVNLDGNVSNILHGDGSWAPESEGGNANYANFAGTAFSVSGSNVTGQVANANLSYYSNVQSATNFTGNLAIVDSSGDSQIYRTDMLFVNSGGVSVIQVGSTYFGGTGVGGNGAGLTNLTGANVTGQVSYAAVANSVAVANVVGIGNIATINLDGSTSNVLYGNGAFAPISVTSVANANYANFAGNAVVSNTVVITNDAANSSNQQVYFGGTGNAQVKYDSSFTYNSNGNTLYVGSIVANANASLLTTGTISSARVVGNYSNITRVGTLNELSVASGTITTSDPVTLTQTWNLGSTSFTGIDVNITTTAYAAASRLLDLRANSVSKFGVDANGVLQTGNVPAARISGTVANATYAVTAGTADSVSVANVSGIGNIATINLDGNSSTVLYGNGVFAGVSATNANYANYAGNAFSVDAANIVGTVNLANYATVANSVAGANVSGEVSFAAVANSVAVANVSGIGNIAVLNLDGNSSNLLYGNGTFAPISITSVANANYANFAGQVVDSTQSNITSVGTLTSLSVTGNIVGGNITTAGLANLANVQLKIFEETLPASANTSTSISPDVSTGTIFRYTANANFTFNSLTNAVAGTSATVIITQDGTGSRTLTSTMKFAGASKTLSTSAGAIDIIGVFYDGTTYYASLTKGYA